MVKEIYLLFEIPLQPFAQLNFPLRSFVKAAASARKEKKVPGRRVCHRRRLTILPSCNTVLFSYYNYLSVNDI